MKKLEYIHNFLNKGQWFEQDFKKTSIVLHHTAGGDSSPAPWWNAEPERVGTAYSITRGGIVRQHFPENHWASAVNVKNVYGKQNLLIEKYSIQIELDNWGGLTQDRNTGKWHNWTAWKMSPNGNAVFLPTSKNRVDAELYHFEQGFRGFKAFEAYPIAQIESLHALVFELMQRHEIPQYGLLKDNLCEADFELNTEAISGKEGLWTHTNFRTTKSDLSPQPIIIEVLNKLRST